MAAAYCSRSTGVPDWLCAYATIRVRFPIHRSLPIHDEWRKATLQPGHREGGSGHIPGMALCSAAVRYRAESGLANEPS